MNKTLISIFIRPFLALIHPPKIHAWVDPPGMSDYQQYNETIGLKGKFAADGATVGTIISDLLPYLLTLAGLILFGMLIWGGFTMLTAATDPKKAEAGKQRITTAVVGFIIIFAAYWLMQIVEIIFGIKVL